MSKVLRVLALIGVGLLLAACTPATPASTPGISVSPTPLPAATPTIPPTLPADGGILAGLGPWYLFVGDEPGDSGVTGHLWALSVDGSEITRLLDEPVISMQVQPDDGLPGRSVALALGTSDPFAEAPAALKLLNLPQGDLIDIEAEMMGANEGGFAFSPDGRTLAYGRAGELLLADLDQGSSRQIAATQTGTFFDLRWSPGGRFLLYSRFEFYGMSGPVPEGLWVYDLEQDRTLALLEYAEDQRPFDFFGVVDADTWVDDHSLLLQDLTSLGGPELVDLDSGERQALGSASQALCCFAYAPDYDTWMAYDSEAGQALLLRAGSEQTLDLPVAWTYEWWPAVDSFYAYSYDARQLYLVSPEGVISDLPWPQGFPASEFIGRRPLDSPDGRWWVWQADPYGTAPVWVGEAMGLEVLPVAGPTGLIEMSWSPDSQRLFLFDSGGLMMAEAPDFRGQRLSLVTMRYPWFFFDLDLGVWVDIE